MTNIDVTRLVFERPRRCDNSGPNCVEVATAESGRIVRDSKTPGPFLLFSEAQWDDMIRTIAAGQNPSFLNWNEHRTECAMRAPGDDTVLRFTVGEMHAFEAAIREGQFATTGARA